jgi:hypothetical protein
MTNEQKITYLRIALALQHIPITDRIADQVIVTYEKILEKGGEFNLKDAIEIEKNILLKYELKP